MKKLTYVGVLLIAACFVLVGCEKKKEEAKDPLIGKWANNSSYGTFVYTFNEDGTCSYDAVGTIMNCTYKTDGDKISILYDGNTESFDTTYKIEGDRLNVLDSLGSDTFYDRQK